MKTDREILLRARELLEQGWTKDAMARTARGNPCSHSSRLAVSWCLSGAVSRAATEGTDGSMLGDVRAQRQADNLWAHLSWTLYAWRDHGDPSSWQDDTRRRLVEVFSLVDRTLAALPEEAIP